MKAAFVINRKTKGDKIVLSHRRGFLLEAEDDCLTERQIAPCKNTCGHARAAAYRYRVPNVKNKKIYNINIQI